MQARACTSTVSCATPTAPISGLNQFTMPAGGTRGRFESSTPRRGAVQPVRVGTNTNRSGAPPFGQRVADPDAVDEYVDESVAEGARAGSKVGAVLRFVIDDRDSPCHSRHIRSSSMQAPS